jgi:hypothetical protein
MRLFWYFINGYASPIYLQPDVAQFVRIYFGPGVITVVTTDIHSSEVFEVVRFEALEP